MVENGYVREPVDYVTTVDILHPFEELFHETFDCTSSPSIGIIPSNPATRKLTLALRKPHFRLVQQIRQILNT
jgi:hypothetical protein